MTVEEKIRKELKENYKNASTYSEETIKQVTDICLQALEMEREELLKQITDYTNKRIFDIVSDTRYNRKNPANIKTNAPLALMQMGWESEADALKELNKFIRNLAITQPKFKE